MSATNLKDMKGNLKKHYAAKKPKFTKDDEAGSEARKERIKKDFLKQRSC